MNMIDAVRTCFQKYANFRDPASRPEYWWFALFNFIIYVLLVLIDVRLLQLVWFLVMVTPSVAVTIRRHHDAGRSGWWILASVISIWEIILLCYPSKMSNNRYVPERSMSYGVDERALQGAGEACPVCGKLRLPGQNYCVGCGTKLSS